jgi:integrase
MASIINTGNGRRSVQFFDHNQPRNRRTIALGKLPQAAAEEFSRNVEALVACKATGTDPTPRLMTWLQGITKTNSKVAEKLEKFGLLVREKPAASMPLKLFLDEYVKQARNEGTRQVWALTAANLVEFFGTDKPVPAVTAYDADAFRLWLADHHKLGDNTVRRRCGHAKQFFRAAVKKRLIAESPFAEMRNCGVQPNDDRVFYVTTETALAVLDACPTVEWRLIFALARYGGLRCPSEHHELRWSDIDWERNRFAVRAPKTGKSRLVPIFPELRPHLDAAYFAALRENDGAVPEFIVKGRNRRNYATQMERIIRRAGIEPWPKIFQNCRATRATELVSQGWPEFKVCKWLGHTEAIAKKHYWKVTDEDYQKAAGVIVEKTLQGALHSPAAVQCNTMKQQGGKPDKHGISRDSVPLLADRTRLPCTTST